MLFNLCASLEATENLGHCKLGMPSTYITLDHLRDLTEVTGAILYAHN